MSASAPDQRCFPVMDWGTSARLSLYRFILPRVRGRRCFSIGYGSGAGMRHLIEGGAASIMAVDRTAVPPPDMPAEVSCLTRDLDLEAPGLPPAAIDVVLALHALDHLSCPDRVLAGLLHSLAPGGSLMLACPPVIDTGMLRLTAANLQCVTNLPPWAWFAKLQRYFHEVEAYRHWMVPARETSPGVLAREDCASEDFILERIPGGDKRGDYRIDTITSVFLASGPRTMPLDGPLPIELPPPEWNAQKVEAEGRQDGLRDRTAQIQDLLDWVADGRRKGFVSEFLLETVARHLEMLVKSDRK